MLAVGNLFYLLGHCFKTQQRDSISFDLDRGGVDESVRWRANIFFEMMFWGVSAHVVLWNILQMGLSRYLFRNMFSNGWGGGGGGGQKAGLSSPPLLPSLSISVDLLALMPSSSSSDMKVQVGMRCRNDYS